MLCFIYIYKEKIWSKNIPHKTFYVTSYVFSNCSIFSSEFQYC